LQDTHTSVAPVEHHRRRHPSIHSFICESCQLLLAAVTGVSGVKGNFLTRIPTALKTYNESFGGPPDLVIMHSNFW
jgi:hypothetical protein